MVGRFFQGGQDQLEHALQLLLQMLADDRHSFDVACSALLDGADPQSVGPDLRQSDNRVNEAQRDLRRELVVHTTAHGTSQMPAVLMYMSVVKDVERIGDYAKNIWDVAALGIDLSKAEDREELVVHRERISSMISEAATIFAKEQMDVADQFIREADMMLDRFDDLVAGLIGSDQPGHVTVPRALLYRYYKRITAHLMNLLSAITMPLDQLDYFDENRQRP
jgi:phosphate uptake regulator